MFKIIISLVFSDRKIFNQTQKFYFELQVLKDVNQYHQNFQNQPINPMMMNPNNNQDMGYDQMGYNADYNPDDEMN